VFILRETLWKNNLKFVQYVLIIYVSISTIVLRVFEEKSKSYCFLTDLHMQAEARRKT